MNDKPLGSNWQAADGTLVHVSLDAMATTFEVLLPGDASREETEAALEVLDWIKELEKLLTIYSPNSDISRINRFGHQADVKVDRLVCEIIEIATDISAKTQGAFDITAGPLIEAWGFTQRSGRKPSKDELRQALSCVGFEHVALPGRGHVRLLRPGIQINLGAIGKGYALDQAASRLALAGLENFLIHGGRSSVLARGRRRRDEGGWPVTLAHPIRPTRKLGRIWLVNESLSTSGSGNQFFHYRGQRMGHVIDPRTGVPAGDMLSLTLLADHCATTDAMATAMFVEGKDAAMAEAETSKTFGIIGVSESNGSELEVFSAGLPAGKWEPFTDGGSPSPPKSERG